MKRIDHENLEVYQKAADIAAKLHHIGNRVPPRRADIRDQLHRGSLSIPQNIAEGAGEYSPAAKANFYRIARRSTTECMGALGVMARIEGDKAQYNEVLDEMRGLVVGLTALAVSIERRIERK